MLPEGGAPQNEFKQILNTDKTNSAERWKYTRKTSAQLRETHFNQNATEDGNKRAILPRIQRSAKFKNLQTFQN